MRKRIVIGGASGFVGTALQNELKNGDWEVTRLTRSEPGPGEVRWHPDAYDIDPQDLAGIDAARRSRAGPGLTHTSMSW